MNKPRFFTGITATGTITLGHYLGVIRHILELQKDYEVIIMIGDLHALTNPKQNFDYYGKCLEIASLLYACGIDENSVIYIQSRIKEHLELTTFLSPFVTVSSLSSMIQYKEKKKKRESGNLSLLTYPVLMAADILLYDSDLIIVGKDQQQHLELASNIASKFNSFYKKEILKIPNFLIPDLGSKIMGMKNPSKKMSKSGDDFIYLLEESNSIRKKILSANTDSDNKIFFDQKKKPGISNLLTIYSSLSGKKIEDLVVEFSEKNYHQFKLSLFREVEKIFDSIKEKYTNIFPRIEKLLEQNENYLKKIAKKKISEVRNILKLSRSND
jgi:tryptophanyl-tRNA synthetase